MVERIRIAGNLPPDNEISRLTGMTLAVFLQLPEISLLQAYKPSKNTKTKRPKSIDSNLPRARRPADRFIMEARRLVYQLTDPTLIDADLYPKHVLRLGLLYPDLIRNLLRSLQINCDSAAGIKKSSATQDLLTLYANHYDEESIGSDDKNNLLNCLARIQTTVEKLQSSELCTNDNQKVLTTLSEHIDRLLKENGKALGRWRSPQQSKRVIRDSLALKLRVFYRFVKPESTDKYTRYTDIPEPLSGHEDEPDEIVASTPFFRILRLTLDEIERDDGEKAAKDTVLIDLIKRAHEIVDPLAKENISFSKLWELSNKAYSENYT
jgi:hypothetical protein